MGLFKRRPPTSTPGACPSCGRDLDEHDRHVRFRLPDAVLDAPRQENEPGTWLSHDDANRSVMMQVPGAGAFVRCLLPIRLTGGHTLTYGLWLSVQPDDLQEAFRIWWEPEYAGLRIDGRLANAVQPWGLLAAPVTAGVRDPEEIPYCESSSEPTLRRVLAEEWPHEEVLGALPDHLTRG